MQISHISMQFYTVHARIYDLLQQYMYNKYISNFCKYKHVIYT